MNWLINLFASGWDRYIDIRCASSNMKQARRIAADSGYAGDDSHFLVRDAANVHKFVHSFGQPYGAALDDAYFLNSSRGGVKQRWRRDEDDTEPEFVDTGWDD
jgi:hypothetical protein